MVAAGRLNKRATFQRATEVEDAGGGRAVTWGGELTVWAEFKPESGRERVQSGRLTAEFGGVLRIRSSSQSRALTEGDRVTIDGQAYNVRSIANPDGRNVILEMTVERGVAT